MPQQTDKTSPFWQLVDFDMELKREELGPSFNPAANTDRSRIIHAGNVYGTLYKRFEHALGNAGKTVFQVLFRETVETYSLRKQRAHRKPAAHQTFIEESRTDLGILKRRLFNDFTQAYDGDQKPFTGLKDLDGIACLTNDFSKTALIRAYQTRSNAFDSIANDLHTLDQIIKRMNDEAEYKPISREMIVNTVDGIGTPAMAQGLFGMLPRP